MGDMIQYNGKSDSDMESSTETKIMDIFWLSYRHNKKKLGIAPYSLDNYFQTFQGRSDRGEEVKTW